MTQEQIRIFINSLEDAKYSKKGETWSIVFRDALPHLEERLIKFLNENHDEEIGMLQAKVKFYEEVISKSTFAPMLGISNEEAIIQNIEEKFKNLNLTFENLFEFIDSRLPQENGNNKILDNKTYGKETTTNKRATERGL